MVFIIENLIITITCHDLHIGRCTNIYLSISLNQTHITTTIDIADSTNSIINLATDSLSIRIIAKFGNIGNIAELLRDINCFASLVALYHVDINLSVGISFSHKATTINIINTGSRLHIHRNLTMGSNWYLYTLIVSFCSRIRCFITTTYQVLDDDRITTIRLFNIYYDIALNTATCIVTTIHILQDTTGNSQMNITMDMGIIGTTMDIVYRTFRTCSQHNVYRRHITLVACSIKSGNMQRTVANLLGYSIRITTTTLGITTTEDLTNLSTLTDD